MGPGDHWPPSQWFPVIISLIPFKTFHGQAESSELVFGDRSLPSPQTAVFWIKSNIFFFLFLPTPASQALIFKCFLSLVTETVSRGGCLSSVAVLCSCSLCNKSSPSKCSGFPRPFRNVPLLSGPCCRLSRGVALLDLALHSPSPPSPPAS